MPPDPADHENRYSSAQAAHAAGITVDTLKNWVSKRPAVILLTSEDREKAGKGNPILYSFARVVQIALAAELFAHGVRQRRAGLAAAAFTDTSTGGTESGWVGDAPDAGSIRMPGQLFHEGFTYLVVPPGGDEDAVNADVVNVTPKTPALMLLRGGMRPGPSAVIVDVNAVVSRVRARLAEPR